MRYFVSSVLVLLLLVVAPVAANAQQSQEGWQFKLGTFFWANDVKAKLETPTTTIDKTADFADLVENAIPSINLTFAAKKDKLAFHTNFFNVHLKMDLESNNGTRGAQFDQYIPEAFVGYEVLDTNLTENTKLTLEPYAGVRYYNTRILIDRAGGGELVDVHRSFTDAIFGLIATVGFGEKLSLTLRGDAGGFGWGGESYDEDYFGLAALNWNYSKNKTLSLGYADLLVKRKNIGRSGDVDAEFEYRGPIFSHTYQF